MDFLKLFHENNVCSRKDNNWLMSPAIFDPDADKETKRGTRNIVAMRTLWLDLEKGDLQPEEFADLFPTTKLIVFNTYSHTKEKPRFRVIFPFEQSLTADEYVTLYDQIVAKIEEAGYWVKDRKGILLASGLDFGKRTPASLFYLPCQAKNPTDSFFLDYYYHDDSRQLLDAKRWVANNVVVPFPKQPKRQLLSPPTTVDQAKVAAATERWRQSKSYPEEGNDRFWEFAVELRSAGITSEQIKAKLIEEYPYARHPQQRKGQIPSIMKSLAQSWPKAA